MPIPLTGGGFYEWVWAAIAGGDLALVRSTPANFDVNAVHPRYGNVFTAFLQPLLNCEGRWILDEENRKRLVLELVSELGRRGARPDAIIPSANFEVKGIYSDWRISGDITALQATIQIRNDLLRVWFEGRCDKFYPDGEDGDTKEFTCNADEGAERDVSIMNCLIDRYADIMATGPCGVGPFASRSRTPNVTIALWERCLRDGFAADVAIASPDGSQALAHSLVLRNASPVLAAMMSSGMKESEGFRRAAEGPPKGLSRMPYKIDTQESPHVVELFLSAVYAGSLPMESNDSSDLEKGTRVIVTSSFMSDSAKSMLVPSGTVGTVHTVDSKGDALIKFDGISARQWLKSKNFWKVREATEDNPAQIARDLAGVLSLCHCWQVNGLAEVISERLEQTISVLSFEPILEAACLHANQPLKTACLAFAQMTPQVREAYEGGGFGATVREALRALFNSNGSRSSGGSNSASSGGTGQERHKRLRVML